MPSPTVHAPARGAAPRHSVGLIGRLNAEWAQLGANALAASRLADWVAHCPALRELQQLTDLESHQRRLSRESADQVLLTLLTFARDGDQLAGRAVFQLMLGRAVRIAARRRGRRVDHDEVIQLAVAALWIAIATYPVDRRPVKVAANLAMEVLHHMVDNDRERGMREITVGEISSARANEGMADRPGWRPTFGATRAGYNSDQVLEALEERLGGPVGWNDRPDPVVEILEVLAWGVQHDFIGHDDAVLVAAVYCPEPGAEGGMAVADEYGLSWAAVRQRCSRAVRRLAAAAVDYSPIRELCHS